MATDVERLAVSIEASTKNFESAMKRVEAKTNAAFKGGASNVIRLDRGMAQATATAGRLERSLQKTSVSAKALSAASTFGRGLAGGLLGGVGVASILSVSGAIGKARDALASFDAIAKSARTTGLSPEFYQSLTFAAVETGISQEKLNAALLIFAKNAGLAANGTGALASGLKKSNPELLRSIQLAETQDERLRLVAEAMKLAGSAAERAALSSVAFGKGGLELTEIFGGGAAALDSFMKRAQEMGVIIDRSLLDKADELDDKLSILAHVINSNVNQSLVNLAQPLVAAATAMAAFSKEVKDTAEAIAKGDIEGFMRAQGAAEWEIAAVVGFFKAMRGVVETTDEARVHIDRLITSLSNLPLEKRVDAELLKQLEYLRDLLGEGTPEAAAVAKLALERLVEANPRFQALADKLKPLIDALIKAKEEAKGLRLELSATPGSFSASDLARASGGETQRFLDERDAEARRTEFDREVRRRTDEIIEGLAKIGQVISRAAAEAQAIKEIGLAESVKSAGSAIDSFVERVVQAESGGRADARNPDSSATGLGQFIESTWLDLFKRHFPDRAKGLTDAAILALRTDAATSRQLIEAYARENAAVLQRAGVSVNEAALQLAHFLGAGDAAKVLNAAAGTPLQGLISQSSINANPTILGGGRTVDDARAYAEQRAGIQTLAAERLTASQQFLASIQEEIAALGVETQTLSLSEEQAARVSRAFEALAEAKRLGLEIGQFSTLEELQAAQNLTPELEAQRQAILALVDAKGLNVSASIAQAEADRVAADAAAEAADRLAEAEARAVDRMDSFRSAARDVLGGFISDLRAGKSASEALANALQSIADKLINLALDSLLNALFGQQGTPGGGLIGGIIGGLFGGAAPVSSAAPAAAAPRAGAAAPIAATLARQQIPRIQTPLPIVIQQAASITPSPAPPQIQQRIIQPAPIIIPQIAPRAVAAVAGPQRLELVVNVHGARGNTEIESMVRSGIREGLSIYDREANNGQKIAGKIGRFQKRGVG